jgi:hypothetical protein
MPPEEPPPDQHQVGITNAQENNPDALLASLTKEMNVRFTAGRFGEAAGLALEITARSRDELQETFVRHGVIVVHLDHEAFGLYEGQIEPTHDVRVEGPVASVLAAAAEFGRRHAQQMILIARKRRENERDPAERLGLSVRLNAEIMLGEAVEIAGVAQDCGFKGATFAPKRQGSMVVYHTENLGMSGPQFKQAAITLVEELKQAYPTLTYEVEEFIVQMAQL